MSTPKTQAPDAMATQIGEIKGLIHGVSEMIRENNSALNRRIDDLHRALTQRMDSHQAQLGDVERQARDAHTLASRCDTRLDEAKQHAGRTGVVSGVSAGSLVAAGIEVAKALLAGHH